MERKRRLGAFTIWEFGVRIIDIVGLFVAMYLSDLLMDNSVFGGAVYLLGDVWVTYMRLYSKRSITLLPGSTRSKGLIIFILAAALTVALVFLFPYLQSKTTAFVVVALIAGFILQQICTDAVTKLGNLRGRTRVLLLFVAHAGFLVGYAALFRLNQWLVGYPVPEEIGVVYLITAILTLLLLLCQLMEGPRVRRDIPDGMDMDKLMDVHAYRVYNKMAVNVFFGINLCILAFICYMRFLPYRVSFVESILQLVAWLIYIGVVSLICAGVLHKRYLNRYDKPAIFLVGILLWVIVVMRIWNGHNNSIVDSLFNAACMGASLACLISIILEQSYDIIKVVELGVGHIDNGAYARNTSAMLDWSRLVSCLLLLVMLTMVSFLMDGRMHEVAVTQSMQRLMGVIMLALPLVFLIAGMVYSLLQPLDKQYAEKLRKYTAQQQAGEANLPLENRLQKILVSNYPRKLALTILRPLARPFLPCKVQGKAHVDLSGGPAIFVCNHLEMYGPIIAVLHSPFYIRPWVIHNMLDSDIIEEHLQTGADTVAPKIPLRLRRWLVKVLTPVVLWIMRSTDPVPVYRGTVRELIGTIQHSVEAMTYDDNILLFPETNYQQDGVGEFFTGFVQVAKSYHKQTGKSAMFYPMYINKKRHTMTYGEGIRFDPENGAGEEKDRIIAFLQDRMNTMAAGEEKEAAGTGKTV